MINKNGFKFPKTFLPKSSIELTAIQQQDTSIVDISKSLKERHHSAFVLSWLMNISQGHL